MFTKIFPVGSKRRKYAKRLVLSSRLLPKHQSYGEWVAERKDKIELFEHKKLASEPLISIVVPAFNTPKRYLEPLLYSVVGQVYENWELILVNASTDELKGAEINASAQKDQRIKVVETKNNGISENTNVGIKKSSGEFVAFMDHDDTLELNALYEVARAINENHEAGLIYSDEDKLSEDGKNFLNPHFKPDYSPQLLTHVNYITHLTVIKKEFLDKVGDLDSEKDGAQDYDLVLRVIDAGAKVVHIPQVLYHWREAKHSTAQDISNKPYIKNAGEKALNEHFKRMKIKAEAKAHKNKPGFYKIDYRAVSDPTVIIPPFSNEALLKKYLSILKKTGLLEGLEVISPFEEKITEKNFLEEALERSGDQVVILCDFAFPNSKDWAKSLAGPLNVEEVHAVSPIVCRPDGKIEDCGLVKQDQEVRSLFRGFEYGKNTYFGDTDWTRNVDFLSGKIIAVRKGDLQKFLSGTNLKTSARTLTKYSADKKNKFNVVTSEAIFTHVRTSGEYRHSSYASPNTRQDSRNFALLPNEKQIMDALLTIEERI